MYIINAFNRNYKYESLTYYMKRHKEYSKPNYKINIIKISAAIAIAMYTSDTDRFHPTSDSDRLHPYPPTPTSDTDRFQPHPPTGIDR